MINCGNYKIFYFVSLLFMNIYSYSYEKYESTKFTGMNKFQRIGEIESYLSKFTSSYPKIVDERLKKISDDISKLSKNAPENNSNFVTSKQLNEQLNEIQKSLKSEHELTTVSLKKEIEDLKKDATIQIDSLRNVLEARILVLEKFISNLGKTPKIN